MKYLLLTGISLHSWLLQPSLATRNGQRRDAILLSPVVWHCTPPSSVTIQAYPSAEDHQGVTVTCMRAIGRPPQLHARQWLGPFARGQITSLKLSADTWSTGPSDNLSLGLHWSGTDASWMK